VIQEATVAVETTVLLLKSRDAVVHSHGRHVCKFQQLRQTESDVPHNQGLTPQNVVSRYVCTAN
jgi:hypothetical protein